MHRRPLEFRIYKVSCPGAQLLFGLAGAWPPATSPCASSLQAPLSGLCLQNQNYGIWKGAGRGILWPKARKPSRSLENRSRCRCNTKSNSLGVPLNLVDQPQGSTILLHSFQGVERSMKIIRKCRFVQPILQYGLLILYRDSTISPIFYRYYSRARPS